MNTKKGEIRLSQNADGTAEIILFFDELFDSFNGKKGQGLSSIINTNSNHIAFWQEAINKLRRMQYVEKESHNLIRRNSPKCLRNWIWTIQGATHLWNILSENGFSSLNLKYLNQDIVENGFGQIRDYGHRNNNPSPYQFCGLFKSFATTNLTSKHSMSSNCEENKEGTSLALLKMFRADEIAAENEEKDTDIECAESAIPEIEIINIYVDAHKILTTIGKHTIAMECAECTRLINSDCILENIKQALQIAELRFGNFCHEIKVKEKLMQILQMEAFSTNVMHCPNLQHILLNETAQQFIAAWCIFVNKILNGTITEECDSSNFIYNEAKRMAMRYKKKSTQIKIFKFSLKPSLRNTKDS